MENEDNKHNFKRHIAFSHKVLQHFVGRRGNWDRLKKTRDDIGIIKGLLIYQNYSSHTHANTDNHKQIKTIINNRKKYKIN